jgi:hypothetical protein
MFIGSRSLDRARGAAEEWDVFPVVCFNCALVGGWGCDAILRRPLVIADAFSLKTVFQLLALATCCALGMAEWHGRSWG